MMIHIAAYDIIQFGNDSADYLILIFLLHNLCDNNLVFIQ